MLLIPFLENALKHSNIEKVTGTFINLKINATESSIDFELENSKPEFKIVKDPNRHELVINETTDAFKVNLKLQLNE